MDEGLRIIFWIWVIGNLITTAPLMILTEDWNFISPTYKYCKRNLNKAGTIICVTIVTILTGLEAVFGFISVFIFVGILTLWDWFKYVFRKR